MKWNNYFITTIITANALLWTSISAQNTIATLPPDNDETTAKKTKVVASPDETIVKKKPGKPEICYDYGYPTYRGLIVRFNKDGTLRYFSTDKVLYENYKTFGAGNFSIRENLLILYPDLWENYRDSVNYMLSQANQNRPLNAENREDSKEHKFYEPQKWILETIVYVWLTKTGEKPENCSAFVIRYNKTLKNRGLKLDKKTGRLQVQTRFARNKAYTIEQIQAWKKRQAASLSR